MIHSLRNTTGRKVRATLALSLLSLSVSTALQAQEAPPPTSGEWGGIGLLQTPTARMADDGDIALTASHNSPYSRYNVTMQPFPWLEGSFRYINVANLRYGIPSVSGDQNYKDKSIDFKIRLLEESHWIPEVAFGVRDLGGTGLFSSEYLVASKRYGRFDASLGVATGYIGNRGDFSNPLGAIDDRYKYRPMPTSAIVNAGKFGASAMFRGPVGIFGGVAYQTPLEQLIVKVEYDGNDYRREPRGANLNQSTPINVGLVYRPSKVVELTAAWERGDAAMFSLTLRGNPGGSPAVPKSLDPLPVALVGDRAQAVEQSAPEAGEVRTQKDWQAIATELRSNAGFNLQRASVQGKELILTGSQSRYFNPAKGLGRSSRVLSHHLGNQYDWYTLRSERLGLPIVDMSLKRDALESYLSGRIDEATLKRSTELSAPGTNEGHEVFRAERSPFGSGFSFGYRQNLGGPDGFILYQVSANYSASYFFGKNVWLTGSASQNLLNNYDKFKYDAPSNLPRVRTDVRKYTRTSDFTLPNLQVNVSRKLSRDVYAIAYAGYLEWMYAGAGSEVLYRPMDQPWAVSANINWVKQRDFNQGFGLRDYSTTTGHATLYYAFGDQQRVIASLSAGRYLAGDYGATANVARVFRNGVTMGAYATKTNVSSAEFGEGSFDKGIYFSIPFDTLLPRSTPARATLVWNPLIRDGGAMLARKYPLYNITGERDERFFYENIQGIAD